MLQGGKRDHAGRVTVYAIVDDALLPNFPLGVELEVLIRCEDAERLIEGVRGDDPEIAASCGSRSASSSQAGVEIS